MHIRATALGDAEQIYEVHQSNDESHEWADVSDCRDQLQWMTQYDAASIVAEIDGRVVGECLRSQVAASLNLSPPNQSSFPDKMRDAHRGSRPPMGLRTRC